MWVSNDNRLQVWIMNLFLQYFCSDFERQNVAVEHWHKNPADGIIQSFLICSQTLSKVKHCPLLIHCAWTCVVCVILRLSRRPPSTCRTTPTILWLRRGCRWSCCVCSSATLLLVHDGVNTCCSLTCLTWPPDIPTISQHMLSYQGPKCLFTCQRGRIDQPSNWFNVFF